VLKKPLESLKWPQDRELLASLSIQELQAWISMQDARQLIFVGQTKEFQHFIRWNYLYPVKLLRFWYRFKRIFKFNA